MTVDEMMEEVCGPLSYSPDDSTHKNRVLRWLNSAGLDMAERHEWPELITRNATFTTTGVEGYDLTGETYAGATFLRVVQDSVRINERDLVFRPKGWMDRVDPQRVLTNTAYYCSAPSRHDFRLFPAEAAGSPVFYDWVKIPATIAAGGAESTISFDPTRHDLLVAGAVWRGKKFIGDTDWLAEKKLWEQDCKSAMRTAGAVRIKNTRSIQFVDF